MTTRTPRTALAPTPLHLLSNIAMAGVLCLSLAAPLANAADAAAQSKLTPSASSSLPPGMSAAETEAFAQFNRASAGQDAAIEPALAAWRGAAATATAVSAGRLTRPASAALAAATLGGKQHSPWPEAQGRGWPHRGARQAAGRALAADGARHRRRAGSGRHPPQHGDDPEAPAHSHYGTRHVAERLATLYGARALFRLLPADDAEGGTLAEVSLPCPTSISPTDAGTPAQPVQKKTAK